MGVRILDFFRTLCDRPPQLPLFCNHRGSTLLSLCYLVSGTIPMIVKIKNITRVRNCPDITILNSLFGILVFLSCCIFCLFVLLYFCLFAFLSFCISSLSVFCSFARFGIFVFLVSFHKERNRQKNQKKKESNKTRKQLKEFRQKKQAKKKKKTD